MTDSDRQAAESINRARRIEDICDQAEAAWKSGQRPRIEDLLAGMDGAERMSLLIELICLEVHYRKRHSESASIREYLERFPEASPELVARALSANDTRRQRTKSLSEKLSLSLKPAETLRGTAGQPSAPELAGMFGRYKILKTLGRGAMGVVYLARDTHLERNVALKVPQPLGPEHEETIERFYREARAAALLRHPHLCPVFDVGQIADRHYISMAYIEGHTLAKYVNPARPQRPFAAAALIRKIALGVQEAHRNGIVHRDLKPANIMVDSRGEPMVMDFGLARNVDSAATTRMTQTGMLVGTPAYMSPEQIDGDQDLIGPPADIWSLGVIFYELLTTQMPFPGSTIYKVISNIQHMEPRPLSELRPDVPPELAAICHRMMSKNIADRFPSMADVADALARVSKSFPIAPPVPPPIGRESTVETLMLKLDDTVTVPRREPAIQQAAKYALTELRLAHWLLGFAAFCAILIAILLVARPTKRPESKLVAGTSLKPNGSKGPEALPAAKPPTVETSPVPQSPTPTERNPDVLLLPAQPPVVIEEPKVVTEPKATEEPKVSETPARLQLETLIGKRRSVGSIALTADGKIGFSAAIWPIIGRVVHKWDLTSGQTLLDHHGSIDAVGCDAKGERVLTGGNDGVVRLLDGLTFAEQSVFRLHTASVDKVAVSPDGRWGASVSRDHSLRLWNLDEHTEYGSLSGAWDGPATQIAFSPDSQFVAATLDSEVIVANSATRMIERRIRCGAIATSLEFSRDGTQIVSSHENGFVLVWDVETGQLLKRFFVGGEPRSAQFLPDGKHLLVAGSDLTLHCLQIETGLGKVETRSGGGAMNQFIIARDAPMLLMVSEQPVTGETRLKTAPLFAPEANDELVSYLVKPPKPDSPHPEIVEWILKMGGKIQVDNKEIKAKADLLPGKPQRITISLDRCPLQRGDMLCLRGAILDSLSLCHTSLEDKDLTPITTTLAQVRMLEIAHSSLGDETLKSTGAGLVELNVEFSRVTAAGLEKLLKRADKLRELHCDARQFTPQVGQAHEQPLSRLTLTACSDTPIQLSSLGKTMPFGLALYGDPAAVDPSPCPDLTPLHDSKTFTALHFYELSFTPENLQHLATHHQKVHICFNRCRIPPVAIDQLRTDLPRCEIKLYP